jgi:hypothetical protein
MDIFTPESVILSMFSMAVLRFAQVLYWGGYFSPRRYFWNLLIGIDQLGNALIGGDPDETITSRAAKLQHKRGWRWLGWVLEKIDHNHLAKGIELDEGENAAFKVPASPPPQK